jgi:hypothetical protein
MRSALVKFAPSSALYLLALAAQVSGYTNIYVASGLAVLATILLLIPAWGWISSHLWPDKLTESPRMGLLEAAQWAYSETRQTLHAQFAEDNKRASPDEILSWYCYYLLGRGVTLWGTRHPSTREERVKCQPSTIDVHIQDGRARLQRRGSGNEWFDDLEVERSQVQRVIDGVQAEND